MSEIADLYNESYHSNFKKAVAENKKYKQVLQEIKEIADENIDTAQYGGICKSILQIISEVEE